MSWTEEKVNKLKELWGKGQTASQIAEIIGGVSRNVIGKAHRLNLSSKIKTRSTFYSNRQSNNKVNETQTKFKGRRGKFKSLLLDKDFEPAKNLNLEELPKILVNIWRDTPMIKTLVFVEEKMLKNFLIVHFI